MIDYVNKNAWNNTINHNYLNSITNYTTKLYFIIKKHELKLYHRRLHTGSTKMGVKSTIGTKYINTSARKDESGWTVAYKV